MSRSILEPCAHTARIDLPSREFVAAAIEAAPPPDLLTRFAGKQANTIEPEFDELLTSDTVGPVADKAIEVGSARFLGTTDDGRIYAVRVQESLEDQAIEHQLAVAAVRYLLKWGARSFGTVALGMPGIKATADISWKTIFVHVADETRFESYASPLAFTAKVYGRDIALYAEGYINMVDADAIYAFMKGRGLQGEVIDVRQELYANGVENLERTFVRRAATDVLVVSDGNKNVGISLKKLEDGSSDFEVIGLFNGNFDAPINADGVERGGELIAFSEAIGDDVKAPVIYDRLTGANFPPGLDPVVREALIGIAV